jgi:hypothetical protein
MEEDPDLIKVKLLITTSEEDSNTKDGLDGVPPMLVLKAGVSPIL